MDCCKVDTRPDLLALASALHRMRERCPTASTPVKTFACYLEGLNSQERKAESAVPKCCGQLGSIIDVMA